MLKPTSAHHPSLLEPLELRFLPEEGLHIEEALPAEWLETLLAESGAGAPLHPDGAGSANIRIEALGNLATRPPVRVHGALSVRLATTCVRCLDPVREAVRTAVDLTLFPEGSRPARGQGNEREEDAELTEAELDEGTYDGRTIDLPGILRESLLLELPMNPRCADEQACSERTAVMLADANRGSEEVVNDRWAALRPLVGEGKPGGKS